MEDEKMTVAERCGFIRTHKQWRHTPTGRWAIARQTGMEPATLTFMGDEMTVINGRVCIPVARAVGIALSDAFKFCGTWYIPEKSAWFVRTEPDGKTVYRAAADKTRAKWIAIM